MTIYLVGDGTGSISLQTGTGSNFINNVTVQCWGAGQAGGSGGASGNGAGWVQLNTLIFTDQTPINFSLGLPGITAGQVGGDTWFNTSATVFAQGGGSFNTQIGDAQNGGGAGQGSGIEGNPGGAGAGGPSGSGFDSVVPSATSVGGAGGSGNGGGSIGIANSATNDGGAGGNGNSGTGGAAGLATGTGNGSNGGPGAGGGGGNGLGSVGNGGAGGNDFDFGGGGGGGSNGSSNSGIGAFGGTPGGGGGGGGSGTLFGHGGWSVIKLTGTRIPSDSSIQTLFFGTITNTIAETGSLVDTVVGKASYHVSVSENLNSTDIVLSNRISSAQILETLSSTDIEKINSITSAFLNETGNLFDTVSTGTNIFSVNISEIGNSIDTKNFLGGLVSNISEIGNAIDTTNESHSINPIITETMSAVDTTNRQFFGNGIVQEILQGTAIVNIGGSIFNNVILETGNLIDTLGVIQVSHNTITETGSAIASVNAAFYRPRPQVTWLF